ncbi:MAG: FtsX-like permease family protein [bacterium]|nr:FtsX-like permease family protein [bacterium]
MKIILFKLLKDFRKSKLKLLLLVLAAALSSWGISTVMYGYFMTERDFEENFLSTNPADLSITIDNYSDALIDVISSEEGVVGVERREVVSGRIKASEESWMPLILFAIEDVNEMNYDIVDILDADNKTPNKFLVERNANNFLLEDQAQVELILGSEKQVTVFQLDGKVHDARQAPAQMEGIVYAYTTSIEMLDGHLPDSRRRLLIETNVSDDAEAIKQVYNSVKIAVEANGGTLVGYNIPTPGEHVHQGIVDGISFMQESGGAILSLMGIILLSLILLTWIYPQISDVGVMKAIGASTSHIFKSYSIVLLIIISIGIVIGLPLGYQTGFLYNKAVAFFQNFEVVQEVLPFQYHLMVIVVGILLPMIFGITPVIKSSKTSVTNAMNKTFYIPKRGFFNWTQKLIGNLKVKFCLNNLLRHAQRTLLIILLLAVGLGLFFTSTSMDYSIRKDLDAYSKTSSYELLLTFASPLELEQVSFLRSMGTVKEYAPINSYRVSYNLATSDHAETSRLRVLSSKVKIEEKYLVRGEIKKNCSECVYISGEHMIEEFEGVKIGERIELKNGQGEIETYVFSGAMKDIVIMGAPFLVYDDSRVSEFNVLAVALDENLNYSEVSVASNQIDDQFIEEGINLKNRFSIKRRMAGILGHLAPTFLIIKILGIFTIVLGLIGLVIVLNLTIEERTREIGIMKSIGAPSKKISVLFNLEFLLITVLAIALGVLLAMPLASGLISVVAEAILKHTVPQFNDYPIIGISATVVLGIQFLVILVYNRYKINRNARDLLDYNF